MHSRSLNLCCIISVSKLSKYIFRFKDLSKCVIPIPNYLSPFKILVVLSDIPHGHWRGIFNHTPTEVRPTQFVFFFFLPFLFYFIFSSSSIILRGSICQCRVSDEMSTPMWHATLAPYKISRTVAIWDRNDQMTCFDKFLKLNMHFESLATQMT